LPCAMNISRGSRVTKRSDQVFGQSCQVILSSKRFAIISMTLIGLGPRLHTSYMKNSFNRPVGLVVAECDHRNFSAHPFILSIPKKSFPLILMKPLRSLIFLLFSIVVTFSNAYAQEDTSWCKVKISNLIGSYSGGCKLGLADGEGY